MDGAKAAGGGGGRKPPKRWSPSARGLATRSRPSPSRRPTPRSAKAPAPARAAGEGSGSGDSAASYGEPHEETFSGSGYVFQAAGEFTLVKSTTDDLDIQVREQRFPGAADVALDTATAMQVGPNIVELAANKSGRLQLWVNRRAVAYGSRALAGGGNISVKAPIRQRSPGPTGRRCLCSPGDTIAIAHETVTCNGSDEINVIVKVAPSRAGHLEGLLGDPGEPFDELVGGNGVVYSLDQLAAPLGERAGLRRALPPVRPELANHPAELALLLPEGHEHRHLHRPCLPEQGAHRGVADARPPSLPPSATARPKALPTPYLLSDCVYDLGLAGGRNVCLAGAEARVQAATGRPYVRPAYPRAAAPSSRLSAAPPSSGTPPTTRHQHRHPGHGRERPERTAGRRSRRVGHGLRGVGAKLDQAELLQAG